MIAAALRGAPLTTFITCGPLAAALRIAITFPANGFPIAVTRRPAVDLITKRFALILIKRNPNVIIPFQFLEAFFFLPLF